MCGEDDGDGGSSSLWWLGVIMSIFASIASNLGVNVQKFSMMREARLRPANKQRAYVAQPIWFGGLLLVIAGSIGDFAALGFAAQSLITPVGGFTMVANVVFAHFWLGEHLSKLDLAGTGLVIVGVVLIAAFADKRESCFDLDQLLELYEAPSFIVYASVVIVSALVLYVVAKRFEKIYVRFGASSPRYKRIRHIHRFIYPTLSGVLGAQSVLFAKSTAELLKSAFRGDDPSPFESVMTYVIILSMFSTIFMQLHWLAVALQWFDAVYCIPVFQCFFIMVTIFGGALYFQELSEFDIVQSIMFPVGVLVTLAGIMMLSQRQQKHGGIPRFRKAVHALRFVMRVKGTIRHRLQVAGEPVSPFFSFGVWCATTGGAEAPSLTAKAGHGASQPACREAKASYTVSGAATRYDGWTTSPCDGSPTPVATALDGAASVGSGVATVSPGSAAGVPAGVADHVGRARAMSMINAANSSHAPLPTGVALAEGLAEVASLVLPASLHNLFHIGRVTGSSAVAPHHAWFNADSAAARRRSRDLELGRRASAPALFKRQLPTRAGYFTGPRTRAASSAMGAAAAGGGGTSRTPEARVVHSIGERQGGTVSQQQRRFAPVPEGVEVGNTAPSHARAMSAGRRLPSLTAHRSAPALTGGRDSSSSTGSNARNGTADAAHVLGISGGEAAASSSPQQRHVAGGLRK